MRLDPMVVVAGAAATIECRSLLNSMEGLVYRFRDDIDESVEAVTARRLDGAISGLSG